MYARVHIATDIVKSQIETSAFVSDGEGTYPQAPEREPGISYHLLAEPIDWSAAPSRTSELYWNGGDMEWRETLTLDQLRAARNQAINAWKLEANDTYFEFAGEQIAYRASDRIEIQAVHNWVTLTGTMPSAPDWSDWPGAWKAISNRWVPLPDVETWKAFTLAIGLRGTAHFKRAQLLKATVAAAATPAEIEAITW